MQTYNIKAALVTEANKAASFSRIKIPGQYISLEVEQFLEKIAAPKDLQGFYYVAQTLASLLQQTDNSLKKVLQLSDYFSTALLVDCELYLSKTELASYKKITAGSYWAKESPLYLLLFGASGFKKSTEDKLFLAAFIKHFIQSKKTLEDPSIQPREHTRSEEVCRAFRWLQEKNSPSFNVKLFSSSIQNWSPGEIASAIDSFLVGARFGKATIRYSRTLYKFFANDWSNIRLKGANGPQKTPRSGGGRRVTTKPEVESVSKTLVTTAVVTNEEGVDAQDTEILRTHIANTIESENERAKYERNSIGAIFDEELQKIGSIDITKALRQKNNLILSSRLLLSRGSLQLLKSLCERRLSEIERHDSVFAVCCMLSTGISLPELSKLKIYRNIIGSENGIVVIEDGVFWQFKHRSSALRPAGQPEYFYRSDEWVYTPCSIVVSNYIQNNSFEHDSCLFETPEHQLRIKIDKLLQRMSENLKTMNISISMIESFLQRFVDASDTVDPVVLDFSYQQEIYATRVSRSYVNISDSERLSMLNQLWRDIADYAANESIANYFQPAPVNTHDAERRTGSCYVPSSTFCRGFVQSLKKNISLHNPTRALKLKDIIEYHNAYTRYVAWMLAFATGYRAVFNPLPALALHIDALQILSISDKDDASFSHSRVVAVAPVLSTQLNFLESHLIRLSELLTIFCPRLFHSVQELLTTEQKLKLMTAEQIKKWFLQQRNSRTQYGPLFYLNDTLESFPVSPTWLSENNGEYLRVPANMGRHWLKTALLVTGLPPELVNWQMGHWQEGQSPLFENSTLSVGDSAEELALVIDKLLTEQGWLAWKSALI